jgi:hypothetical protein
MSGSFLQTPATRAPAKPVEKAGLSDDEEQAVTAFLSIGYAPQSGEITGIRKQMGDYMGANLKSATDAEEKSISIYNDLMAAKRKEVEATKSTFEAKVQQIGELGEYRADAGGSV